MVILKVFGMTCEHCVAAVTRAVKAVPAVEDVTVDLTSQELRIRGTPDERAVRDAIAQEGFEVQGSAC